MDYVNGPSTNRQRHPLTDADVTKVFTNRTDGTRIIRLVSDRANTHDIMLLFVPASETAPTVSDVQDYPDYYLVAKDTRELEVAPNMNVYATTVSGGSPTLIAKEVYAQG